MQKINNPVKFSEDMKRLIKRIMTAPDYNHLSWSCEELQDLRRHIREHYRFEQKLKCAYCANPVAHISASGAPIEHIVPKSSHPKFAFEPLNLCVICTDCNEIKRAQEVAGEEIPLYRKKVRYPTSTNAFKIVHPHFDDYSKHIFKANHVYVGITQKGNWTVYACKLNRYFLRFGVCDELVNDVALIAERARFHEARNSD